MYHTSRYSVYKYSLQPSAYTHPGPLLPLDANPLQRSSSSSSTLSSSRAHPAMATPGSGGRLHRAQQQRRCRQRGDRLFPHWDKMYKGGRPIVSGRPSESEGCDQVSVPTDPPPALQRRVRMRMQLAGGLGQSEFVKSSMPLISAFCLRLAARTQK